MVGLKLKAEVCLRRGIASRQGRQKCAEALVINIFPINPEMHRKQIISSYLLLLEEINSL